MTNKDQQNLSKLYLEFTSQQMSGGDDNTPSKSQQIFQILDNLHVLFEKLTTLGISRDTYTSALNVLASIEDEMDEMNGDKGVYGDD